MRHLSWLYRRHYRQVFRLTRRLSNDRYGGARLVGLSVTLNGGSFTVGIEATSEAGFYQLMFVLGPVCLSGWYETDIYDDVPF